MIVGGRHDHSLVSMQHLRHQLLNIVSQTSKSETVEQTDGIPKPSLCAPAIGCVVVHGAFLGRGCFTNYFMLNVE